MNSVARPINVAAPDSLQTEKEIAVLARVYLFELIGKSQSRFAAQPGDRPPRPFPSRPGSIGKKPGAVPRFVQAARQSLQVSLGTAGVGMPAPDQPDC